MTDKTPNFLIVGAAKSGTTSVVNHLRKNSEIFISKKKEPRFLTFEFLKEIGYKGPGDFRPKEIAVKTLKDYHDLFKIAPKEAKVIGEASVDTLYYYEKTIPIIKKIMGNPKIIIILRSPVERAISAYSHLIREERENLNFSKALIKEEERMKQGYEYIWAYAGAGMYYNQVKAFKNAFTNVKVVIFEDFIKNEPSVMNEIEEFLEVTAQSVYKKEVFNKTGKPKNKLINKFLTRKSALKNIISFLIGKKIALKIKNTIQDYNLDRIQIDDKMKKDLYLNFEKDIKKLESFLEIDLNVWKKY